MAREIDPPERQAEEALREAVRKIVSEGSRWARENRHVDTSSLDAAIAQLDSEIAALEGWRAGHCTGCGMDDELVKGPPGAQLCRFCDELRILPPLPASIVHHPPDDVLTFYDRWGVAVTLFLIGVWMGIIVLLLHWAGS